MITGSIVALVTPMHPDGSIHWDALAVLIDMHIEQGTSAIVAVGTTGESATLDVDEHCAVVKFTVERAAGRIAVVAGTGATAPAKPLILPVPPNRLGQMPVYWLPPITTNPPRKVCIAIIWPLPMPWI